MSSGSTDPCPDDGDDESNYNLDETNVYMNNEIHSIVQRYCYTNIGTAEVINVNNEFVKTYSTTREWDEDVANDSEYVGNQVEQEFSIPIELMEVRGCREIFPNAAHRHYLRHLRENFKKAVRRMGFGDVEFLCQKMYMASNTDDPMVFDRCMIYMINVKADIHHWLVERQVTLWALLYDGGFCYGVMTTNAAESFNGVLKRARGLPVQALVTAIYYNVIALHLRRMEMLEGYLIDATSPFAQRVQALLRKIEQEARRLPQPIRINMREFQVVDMSSRSFRVDRSNWAQHNPASGTFPLLPPNFRRRTGRPRTNHIRNTMDEARGYMADAQDRGRGRHRRPSSVEPTTQPPVHTIHPSISLLAGSHRAAYPEQGTILEASSHLLMVHEWPINCPRFMEALVFVALDGHMVYIDDPHYFDWTNAHQPVFTSPVPSTDPYDAGPSSYPDLGPSQSQLRSKFDIAPTPHFVPSSSLGEHPVSHPDVSDQEERHLRTRPLRAPQHFTPGTNVIPHRRKRRH
ncbi:hypothetical protein M5K25_009254 [Dendrobium thyrsiflorum]|uniref:MULE transposase domain-containing protein n=1 Tax=Dendrobium thyrsiflorum TaxID=117978 RepID=A0ABD0VBW4_DENTH